MLEVRIWKPIDELQLQLDSDASGAAWEDVWDPAVEAFVHVCFRGGFGPVVSRTNRVRVASIGDHGRRYTLPLRGLTWGALRVLANMCAARQAWSKPLRQVIFATEFDAPHAGLDRAKELMSVAYPTRSPSVSFDVDIVPSVYAAPALTIQVSLFRLASCAEMAALSDALTDWLEVANGGYPDVGFEPQDAVVAGTELYEHDPRTLEMRLPFFSAAYEAFEPVVAMLDKFNSSARLIASFTVAQ